MNKIILTICGMLLLSNLTYADMLDSGVPVPKIYAKVYTKEISAQFIGKRAIVSYINENIHNRITVQVRGVLWDRFEKGEKYLLLCYTEFKNRIVIPIEKIYLIEEIK